MKVSNVEYLLSSDNYLMFSVNRKKKRKLWNLLMSSKKSSIRWFSTLGIKDVPIVGGKNASLGEMLRSLTSKGIKVPDGFATTSQAYWDFLKMNHLDEKCA